MSLIHLPRVTKHWNYEIGTPFIKETMPANKFEKIRQFIHFNDNSKMPPREDPNADRLFKIRPILTKLNETCMQITLKSQLCVDEQICSTKARNNLKRYNPKKPKKWGYKIFVLCDTSGFAYSFEVESGAENIIEPGEPDLGAGIKIIGFILTTILRRCH
ncbi:piggyBac transposable element-derived protein 4-like [Rhagoletis pomonella]|uniref:piggyBac transposable element-derived protein 4-like n=1 Tax=Rhagoletis pomonella TaxID=28610 RepID=UPI00177E54B8|nr:piggyBac transposable element-derived protein 4-like [Rhagoletis pomonella]